MTTKTPDGIEVEINERIAVTDEDQRFEAYCSECRKMTEITTPKIAGILNGLSERDIFRLIEEKQIHFIENARVLVCTESLRNRSADSSTASD